MKKVLLPFLSILLFTSCNKINTDPPVIATLTTTAASAITPTTATSGGNITDDGGAEITVRGVCWNTSAGPTVANSKTTDSSGTGSFASSLTGLTTGTTYYIRAYATNGAGTAYGNEVTFTTTSANLATITTTAVTTVTVTTAISGGNINNDGGTAITARGVCWNTSTGPTVANSKTTDGTGTGSFAGSLTGLTSGTTYYIRAYATNNAGTAYGNEVSFTTLQPNSQVTICSQVWMTKNLDVDHYRNGDPIPKVESSATWYALTTGAYCYYNNDSATYAAIYGKLYNWYAVNDPRGLAPVGWRIPNNSDWNKLVKCVDPLADTLCITCQLQGTTAGGAMKETGTTHWLSPNIGATNSSGFTGLPGGTRLTNGSYGETYFQSIHTFGNWWSSTEYSYSLPVSWCRDLSSDLGNIIISSLLKATGASVRCLKDTSLTFPTITTTPVSIITATTAASGGGIMSDGGAAITERGICFNTNTNPTISNTKLVTGNGNGTFISNVTGLVPGTTYYVRAYAINNNGTFYGNEVSFTTLLSDPTETTICSQVWMTKNLDVDHFRNGDPIPQVTDSATWVNLTTGAWCYYNNNPSNNASYGKLYNWYAVNDPRGLAPTGWHVPTDAEWTTLENCLGLDMWPPVDSVGGKLKEAGTLHWASPNTKATNSSGFTGLPGGGITGRFINIGYNGYYWSSTGNSVSDALLRQLFYNYGYTNRNSFNKKYGFSVRCLRD